MSRGAELVDRERDRPQLVVAVGAHERGGVGVGQRQVVALVGLGGGREDRLGQPLGLTQSGGERPAHDRAGLLVVGPRGTEQVAPRHTLQADRLRRLHQHRPTGHVATRGLGKVGGVGRHQMIGREVGGLLEPERGQRGEDPALVGDEVGEHDVEHRHAVGRDHQHAVVIDLVELAHLPAVPVRQRQAAHRACRRLLEHVDHARGMRHCVLEIEARIDGRGVEVLARSRHRRRARRGTGAPLPTCGSRRVAPSGRRRHAGAPTRRARASPTR